MWLYIMFTINVSQKYLCDYQLINKNIKDIEKNPIQVSERKIWETHYVFLSGFP